MEIPLSKLLIKSGQLNKAEEFYNTLIEQISDDRTTAYIYHQLTLVKMYQGVHKEPASLNRKSLEIHQKLCRSRVRH